MWSVVQSVTLRRDWGWNIAVSVGMMIFQVMGLADLTYGEIYTGKIFENSTLECCPHLDWKMEAEKETEKKVVRIFQRNRTDRIWRYRERDLFVSKCKLFILYWGIANSLGFLGGSDSKESASSAGDPGLIPGLGRSCGEGNGYLLQYSCLENSMDRGAWWATVHGIARVGHGWATNTFIAD